jgi:hypothetical protein
VVVESLLVSPASRACCGLAVLGEPVVEIQRGREAEREGRGREEDRGRERWRDDRVERDEAEE